MKAPRVAEDGKPTRGMAMPGGRRKAGNTVGAGFEQQIKSAADKPRGNMDASGHESVVLL